MLVLSSQARLLGSNSVVWLCDQEPVRTLQKGPPPEKAKLRRWWTYLSQLRLTVHHIQGVKNECADYISRNNFDALIGARSEVLVKEAFSRMDVHLDLNMTMIRPGVPASEGKGHPEGTARHTQRGTRGAGRGKQERHNTRYRPEPPPNRPRAPRTHRRDTAPAKAVVAHSATPQPLG